MLFAGMLSFQLVGALILLLNSLNGSRTAVIRNCFPGSNIVERDDNDNCAISKESLQKSAYKIYLNITAFFNLVVGYGIAAFCPSVSYTTLKTVLAVIGCSAILLLLEYCLCRLTAHTKYAKDIVVAYHELEKYGVETFETQKEIDDLFDK